MTEWARLSSREVGRSESGSRGQRSPTPLRSYALLRPAFPAIALRMTTVVGIIYVG